MDIIQVDSIYKYNEEHYNKGFNNGIRKAMSIIHDYMNEYIIEDIETNSPRSPELDLLDSILQRLKRTKPEE